MTIQLAATETSDPRLLTDSYKQNGFDSSFEEKLKAEKERLGLLFSPLAQLNSFFSSPLELSLLSTAVPEQDPHSEKNSSEPSRFAQSSQTGQTAPPSQAAGNRTVEVFEAAGTLQFNRQLVQELLSRSNLLVPNLAAQPLFSQAFEAGQLEPRYDLQALIDQIVQQVNLVKNQGKTELSLNLQQEGLGDIYLQLTELSGKVAIFMSASPETKKLIDEHKDELEQALKKARVELASVTIEEVKTC